MIIANASNANGQFLIRSDKATFLLTLSHDRRGQRFDRRPRFAPDSRKTEIVPPIAAFRAVRVEIGVKITRGGNMARGMPVEGR
jgi:hypothetical protein